MVCSASVTARSNASAVRDLAARKHCLNFDQASSIGFRILSNADRERINQVEALGVLGQDWREHP